MKKIIIGILTMLFSLSVISNVKAEEFVAKIGDINYTSLDEAVKASKDGDTITLLQDAKATKTFYKSLTFTGGYTVSIDVYGWRYNGDLVFDGANLSINTDANSPVANNGEAGRWFTMVLNGSITAKNGANITFAFDSASGTNCAIYTGNKGVTINVDNKSSFRIYGKNTKGISGQGIQLDSTANTGIFVTNKSEFLIDGTNRGYVNSPEIYVKDSKFTVRNCTANGSNGGKFTAINSEITFYNNGGHGLSATTLDVEKSNVTTNKNKIYGISIGSKMSVDSTSTIISNENGYGYTGGALRIATSFATGYFDAGAKVTFINNHRNAIENYGTTVFEDGVELSITGNKEPKNGAGVFNGKDGNLTLPINAIIMNNQSTELGGGVYNKGLVIIPNSVKIYNNHALSAGDDIYVEEGGTITFGNVGTNWYLDGEPDCTDLINGWYDDSEISENEDSTIIGGRWNAHGEEKHIELVNADKYEGTLAIKAAHNLEGKVITHYVDEEGNTLLEDKIITGYVDDEYQTTSEEIDGYTLIKVKGEEKGKITEEDTEVTYVYQFTKGQGTVDPIDPIEPLPPHTSSNNSIFILLILVNALGASVLLKKSY